MERKGTYLDKPLWQDVHGEQPEEFNAIKSDRLLYGSVTVILGDESNLPLAMFSIRWFVMATLWVYCPR